MKPLELIVARDSEGGIGAGGDLAWHLPGDLKFFQDTTRSTKQSEFRNAVIMGRKTWESIPARYRPLSGRFNIVVSRNTGYVTENGVPLVNSLEAAVDKAMTEEGIERIFIVGGGMLYKEALEREDLQTAWITEVEGTHGCDTFFPPLPDRFSASFQGEERMENGTTYRFVRYDAQTPIS